MLQRLLLAFLILACSVKVIGQTKFYVSVHGNDLSNGTIDQPLASIDAAIKKTRTLRRINNGSLVGAVQIILKDSIVQIAQPIVIRPEDAGTAECPTIIASQNGQSILSGGIEIKGWKKNTLPVPGLNNRFIHKIWVADLPEQNGKKLDFRQLWVNDRKAIRAKSSNGDQMERILDWNKKDQTCIIPTPHFNALQRVDGIEMFIHQWWEIAILRIRKMEINGDSTKLFFHQPESKIQSEHPWPAPWLSSETGNSAFYLTNAIQFLDEPGEWYADVQNRKIYYYPRDNEQMQIAKTVVPFLETLVSFEGTAEAPVSNFQFKNISFEHVGWMRPSLQGHVPHQVGLFMTEAYKLKPVGTKEKPMLDNQAFIGRPNAAIELKYSNQISFENCRFQHLASAAIDCKIGVKQTTISGNLFKDIGGNAIIAGNYGDEGREIHLNYVPKTETDICESIKIENNLITDATNEDWGTVGIALGYLRNCTIQHNELENISYSGISMGWGWNVKESIAINNKLISNKILHYGKHNYDCAGIYTLSNQPNSQVLNNYIDSIYKAPYAHLPSHWFYLYADEGSANISFTNNWTPSKKYLQNANGPNNVWDNNGPEVSNSIKMHAGLSPEFQYLVKEKTSNNIHLPINEEHKELIELVVQEGKQLDLVKLKNLLLQNHMDSSAIYQWQNHYVLFDKVTDLSVMQGRLQNNFPELELRMYHNQYYTFSKKKHCPDAEQAKEWTDIILTANLVEDKKMQQEYFDAHATQFEKLPQIAAGFCNANFQQLMMFQNGRQLMLVISIPKGEDLNKLNPKTTEGNPTMVEWNKNMAKYQEGIKGTKKGETWVFFKKIND